MKMKKGERQEEEKCWIFYVMESHPLSLYFYFYISTSFLLCLLPLPENNSLPFHSRICSQTHEILTIIGFCWRTGKVWTCWQTSRSRQAYAEECERERQVSSAKARWKLKAKAKVWNNHPQFTSENTPNCIIDVEMEERRTRRTWIINFLSFHHHLYIRFRPAFFTPIKIV